MAGYGLHEQQPVSLRVKDHYVGHFAVAVNADPQLHEQIFIKVAPFFAGVASINQDPARHISRRELFDDRFYQLAMISGADPDRIPLPASRGASSSPDLWRNEPSKFDGF